MADLTTADRQGAHPMSIPTDQTELRDVIRAEVRRRRGRGHRRERLGGGVLQRRGRDRHRGAARVLRLLAV